MTYFALAVAALVVGCGPKHRGGRETVAAARTTPSCVDVPAKVSGEDRWVAQLPAILQYKITEVTDEGVVAEPLCVRDGAHTPDWEDVVETRFLFPNQFEVTYGRSIRQLESTARFAKLQVLSLTQHGKVWSGKMREVLKHQGLFDAALDSFLPIEREIELPTCTEAEMIEPVELPRHAAPVCH